MQIINITYLFSLVEQGQNALSDPQSIDSINVCMSVNYLQPNKDKTESKVRYGLALFYFLILFLLFTLL